MKEGYGGRAGSHQFDERVLIGVRTEDVWARLTRSKIVELFEVPEEFLGPNVRT